MEIVTGQIIEIFEEKQITDKFKKVEFGLLTEEDKPQELLLQCINSGCEMLLPYNSGDRIEVQFRVLGRKSKGRYFNTLTVTQLKFAE